MKKILLVFAVMTIALGIRAQDKQAPESKFPYAKMLKMTEDQLREAKFKFIDNLNQWVLTKNQTVAILGALNGSATNYIPNTNDYQVIIQKGLNGVAFIKVVFYSSEIYHEIMTFANDNGINLLETTSGKLTKTQFNYDNYSFVLNREAIIQYATVSSQSYSKVKSSSKDQSYEVYSFVIYTGEQPHSKWLQKEANKQEKRDIKGKKKQSAGDFM